MDANLAQLVDRIRAAAAAGTPLRIRGGGTKDFYGESLQGELLDTRSLSGISSYEPSELVVTVKAGTPLAALEAALAEKGQCLPFEPPHYRLVPGAGDATVGGMVAAGLSGPARATAGSVRDYVLGLSMVNGRAEHLTFGGQVMKNVAGYDVSRVMAGSLGTLGLITEVSLKVLPFAPAEATLRFALDEGEAIRRLNTWAGDPLPLNASSWVVDGGQPVLYLRLRGAMAAVEAACQRLEREGPGERIDSPQTRADWDAARDLQLPWLTQGLARGDDLWRLSVPRIPHAHLARWQQMAEAILRKCVHCGFCTATCPTYQLLGDELDGPRGRIYLMKQVLEGETPTRKTQLHLDRCLTCRNCESTCPSGVHYGHLVDIGRKMVDAKVPRPAGERPCAGPEGRPAVAAVCAGHALGQMVRPACRQLRAKVPAAPGRRHLAHAHPCRARC
jgi:glycolate oxidase FAD binding subunit